MVEGDLSPDEKIEVAYFLQKHPQLQQVMNAYKGTVLKADEKTIFTSKESLHRAITVRKL